MALPPVFIEFIGSAGKFKAAAGEVETTLTGLEKRGSSSAAAFAGAVAKGGAILAGASAVIAVKAVGMASDFNAQMTKLVTAAGEAPAALKQVSDGILQLARDTGTSTDQLAQGMYVVESAGFHGAAGLQVLKAAAQGAKLENADLGTVTNAVTSLLIDYHLKAGDAATVTSQLVTAVGHGKTTFQGLAAALPNVAAAANSAHITLAEMAGAVSEMTMHGTDAAKAGTYLRQVIGQLEAPSAKARGVMQSLGIDANKLGLTLGSGSGHGLSDAITMLEDGIKNHMTPSGLVALEVFKKSKGATSDYQKVLADLPPNMRTAFGALSDMTGGVRSLQGFLQLGGENLKTFKSNTKDIAGATADASGNVKEWSTTQKTFSVEVARGKEYLETWMIQLGQKLIPLIQKAIDWVSAHRKGFEKLGNGIREFAVRAYKAIEPAIRVVITIIRDLIKWVEQHRKGLEQLAKVIGGVIIFALKNFALSVQLLWDAIHAVLIIFGNVWDWCETKLPKAFRSVVKAVTEAYKAVEKWFTDLPGQILKLVKTAGSWLYNTGKSILQGMWNGILDMFKHLGSWFIGLKDDILGWLGDAGQWLLDVGDKIIHGLWNGISKAAGWLWGKLKGFVGDFVSNLESGFGIWSPSRLMADRIGKYIPAGIAKGILDNRGVLNAAMKDVTNGISTPRFGVGPFTGSFGPGSLGGLSGGASVVNVNVQVQGSVQAERDLAETIQTQFQRGGLRRGVTKTWQNSRR